MGMEEHKKGPLNTSSSENRVDSLEEVAVKP